MITCLREWVKKTEVQPDFDSTEMFFNVSNNQGLHSGLFGFLSQISDLYISKSVKDAPSLSFLKVKIYVWQLE